MWFALLAAPADACSLAPTPSFSIDPAETEVDSAPPEVPVVLSARLVRAHRSELADDYPTTCRVSFDTCGDRARFEVEVASSDDRTAEEELGYRVIWLGGLRLHGRPLLSREGIVSIDFDDFDDEALDARFQVVAVDRAGNESEPSDEASVYSPATPFEVPPCGPQYGLCGSGAASSAEVGAGLVGILLFGRRRRRRA